MAADMRLPAPPPPVVYYDWSGAYIGFNAGGVWYNESIVPFRAICGVGGFGPGNQGNFTTSDSDGIFGFHAGAQWQWGAWVLGAEAALSGCFRECRSTSGTLPGPPFSRQHVLRAQDHQPVHGGPAAGLCLGSCDDLCDRWLCFGRSQGHVLLAGHRHLRAGGSALKTAPSRNNGWYAGGGFDYMVHKGALVDVLLGLEYQHFDVGSHNCVLLQPGLQSVPTGADYDLGAKGDIVRARLTIKTQGYGFLLPVTGSET